MKINYKRLRVRNLKKAFDLMMRINGRRYKDPYTNWSIVEGISNNITNQMSKEGNYSRRKMYESEKIRDKLVDVFLPVQPVD